MANVRPQTQHSTTMHNGTQQEVLTEKEVMSRKYNDQMQKQMGWNNPFEVRLAQECHQRLHSHSLVGSAPPVTVSFACPESACDS